MNWNDHLPALLLMIPLFGAFAAPLVCLLGKTMRNVLLVGLSFVTLLVALLLWKSVLAGGIAVYVMGGESFNLTLPSGMALPIRINEVDVQRLHGRLRFDRLVRQPSSQRTMEKFTGLGRFVSLYFLLTLSMLGMCYGRLFQLLHLHRIASIASSVWSHSGVTGGGDRGKS